MLAAIGWILLEKKLAWIFIALASFDRCFSYIRVHSPGILKKSKLKTIQIWSINSVSNRKRDYGKRVEQLRNKQTNRFLFAATALSAGFDKKKNQFLASF